MSEKVFKIKFQLKSLWARDLEPAWRAPDHEFNPRYDYTKYTQ